MANQEHVERLRRSTQVWNAWRQKYPKIQPDLGGAIITNEQLKQARSLRGAIMPDGSIHP